MVARGCIKVTQRAIDGPHIYFVTTNVQDRQWFFITPERAETLGQAVQTCCRLKNFELLAYCILPNHVHLLVRKQTIDEVRFKNRGSQRRLGSLRCDTVGNETDATSNIPSNNALLFPHRRRPRRRCESDKQYALSELMHSIKGTFSHSLDLGKFWQHRSNFRIVDTDERLYNTVDYIVYNYKKMNLDDKYSKSPFIFVDQGQISRLFE